MKANAKGTPPRLAATPLNEVTNVRNHRGRRRLTTANASSTPMIPPIAAVSTESLTLSTNESRNGSSRAWSIAGFVLVDECDRALTNTVTAGNTRNTPTKARNGSRPTVAGMRNRRRRTAATPPVAAAVVIAVPRLRAGDHRAPVVRQHLVGLGQLGVARELDLGEHRGVGQVLGHLRRHQAGLLELGVARRDGPALEVPEGTVVAQDVLDPQLRRIRLRAVGDHALRVVAAVQAVGGDGVSEVESGVLHLRLQRREVIGPVEDDRRLALDHRRRVDVGEDQVAAVLQ